MSIPDMVWASYAREQARLRRLEVLSALALDSMASGSTSTAYIQVERRKPVIRRRLRRLELLLARIYRAMSKRREVVA